MSPLQSRNITSLSSSLGFGDGFQGRDSKDFRTLIAKFRLHFTSQGHPLPFSNPYSTEAYEFAEAFCEEDEKGQTLWPATTPRRWPCWQVDKELILQSLAHIFSLQAFYQYQKEGKARKKAKSHTPPLSPGTDRDLSPESRAYIDPLPPKGTKRRPNKHAEEETEEIFEITFPNMPKLGTKRAIGPEDHQECIDEIEALDPRRDDKPISDFTTQWLTKIAVRWPTQGDARLKTFMHEHDYYNIEDADHRLIHIIEQLRKGTQIESYKAQSYITFKQRIQERVTILADDLLSKHLLEQTSSGKTSKTPCFRSYWEKRHEVWNSKTTLPKKPHHNPPGAYDFDGSTDDANEHHPFSSGKRVRDQPTEVRSNILNKVQPLTEMTKASDKPGTIKSAGDDPESSRQHKRLKLIMGRAAKHDNSTSSPSETITVIHAAGIMEEDSGAVDSETNEHIALAEDILSPTNHRTEQGILPQGETLGGTDERHEGNGPKPQDASRRQRLVLVLQNSATELDFDYENTLSSLHLRELSVSQFFLLYSQRANVPLPDCLTFTFMFAPGIRTVIPQGDEAAWSKMVKKTKDMFKFQKHRKPKMVEFEIFVEIGDKEIGEVLAADDDDDDDW
ncbi:uncharacterized protein PAC_08422 [Phialocephala subalpina]|uniref:Uncharacterized protein n=1 Tax=Phialocephala subalpina TaxID=576137 RepID=A0A1L7X0J5_9HELO|nr:uncharacterized protein PAC_08422 [Phialocephala subalpina]